MRCGRAGSVMFVAGFVAIPARTELVEVQVGLSQRGLRQAQCKRVSGSVHRERDAAIVGDEEPVVLAHLVAFNFR